MIRSSIRLKLVAIVMATSVGLGIAGGVRAERPAGSTAPKASHGVA